jgi:hypothetical protein
MFVINFKAPAAMCCGVLCLLWGIWRKVMLVFDQAILMSQLGQTS